MATQRVNCLLLLVFALLSCSWFNALGFRPISDSHRRAAVKLFPTDDGSIVSLEEMYQAHRTFEILEIERKTDSSSSACQHVLRSLESASSSAKDLFYALKVNNYLKCEVNYQAATKRMLADANIQNSLHDLYHSIGSLVIIKEQTSKTDLHLPNAEEVFRSVMSLRQSDGKWKQSLNSPDSSIYASGLALEALAGIISLSSSEIESSQITAAKKVIIKLFDSMEMYDDGTFYFDDNVVDDTVHQGPLSTSWAVLKGITSFATLHSTNLNFPKEKILGLSKFVLGVGTPDSPQDLFHQIDSLACLENNRVSVPLILHLPNSVLSLTKKDPLKVKVNTPLGKPSPPLQVKINRVLRSDAKNDVVLQNQVLSFLQEEDAHVFDFPKNLGVGSFVFVFEASLNDPDLASPYFAGGETEYPLHLTGEISVENTELAVLDSDLGVVESHSSLDGAVSVSANQLQKLRLSFQLSYLGHAFLPHQAFVKLTHESKLERVFLVEKSGSKFELLLDFRRIADRAYYMSGKYDVSLTVGDPAMENSFSSIVCVLDLDLPESPEKMVQPAAPVDPDSRYGPKPEITHIFRAPEKRPPKELSFVFTGLACLPFVGFLLGMLRIGVNAKGFPAASFPAMFGVLFHAGVGAVLLVFVMFWIKWDLFRTLKTVAVLIAFLLVVGHRILSHIAGTSAKLKHN